MQKNTPAHTGTNKHRMHKHNSSTCHAQVHAESMGLEHAFFHHTGASAHGPQSKRRLPAFWIFKSAVSCNHEICVIPACTCQSKKSRASADCRQHGSKAASDEPLQQQTNAPNQQHLMHFGRCWRSRIRCHVLRCNLCMLAGLCPGDVLSPDCINHFTSELSAQVLGQELAVFVVSCLVRD